MCTDMFDGDEQPKWNKQFSFCWW